MSPLTHPAKTRSCRGADLRPGDWIVDDEFYGLVVAISGMEIIYGAGSRELLGIADAYQVSTGPLPPPPEGTVAVVGTTFDQLDTATAVRRAEGTPAWRFSTTGRVVSHDAVEEYHPA